MFVPSLCNFYYDKLGYGHTMSSRLGGIPVPMRRDYVYVAYPFFYAVAEHIINTRSIDMKKRTGESFRHIAARIPQQSASKIIATISPVCKELDILLSPQFLLFPHEGYPTFPVPLANIYGALLTSHHLYILCQNGVFHCFERETRNHEIAFLDDREIDFYHFHMN